MSFPNQEIGYIHFRSVDTTRYVLYFLTDYIIYYKYKNQIYKIKLPEKFDGKKLDITLNNKTSAVDYENEVRNSIINHKKYPIGYYSNTNKFIETSVDFPSEIILDVMKTKK